jgi:hypothetical protein
MSPATCPPALLPTAASINIFQALERLEELHLVTVDRDAEDYREWVMREPEDEISVRSPGRIRSIPFPLWQSGQQQRCTA